MSKTVVFTSCPAARRDALYERFAPQAEVTRPAFSAYRLKLPDCVITAYLSGKIVFQGNGAEEYAAWLKPVRPQALFPQAGSDEVGTGDYFGPVCVCAAIVSETDLPLLRELGVTDSKLLADTAIRKIAPVLKKRLCCSLLLVMPEKYNRVHQTTNMNAIKAQLHNQAYVNLAKKAELPAWKIVDQFAPPEQYYAYLSSSPVVIGGLHFETKAESKYPSVGAASVIARGAFLDAMEQMNRRYGMVFAKGAGKEVDQCARRFIRTHGQTALEKVAKLHFKNTERILNSF